MIKYGVEVFKNRSYTCRAATKGTRGLAAEGSEGILIKTTVAAFADFCFLDLCADLSRELDT